MTEAAMTVVENAVSAVVLDAAIELHRELGPGLLESVYEAGLASILRERRLQVARQVPIPIVVRGVSLDEGFRADLVVEGCVIVEVKSLVKLHPVNKKQLLTYLRVSGLRLGLLVNFGEVLLRDGFHRVSNGVEYLVR